MYLFEYKITRIETVVKVATTPNKPKNSVTPLCGLRGDGKRVKAFVLDTKVSV